MAPPTANSTSPQRAFLNSRQHVQRPDWQKSTVELDGKYALQKTKEADYSYGHSTSSEADDLINGAPFPSASLERERVLRKSLFYELKDHLKTKVGHTGWMARSDSFSIASAASNSNILRLRQPSDAK
jgi:hypothetical protein